MLATAALSLACGTAEPVPLRVEESRPTRAVAQERSEPTPRRVVEGDPVAQPAEPRSAPAEPRSTSAPGEPAVECQVLLGGQRMQANASWRDLPAQLQGEARIGYDYVWHQPARDGSTAENRFRLTGEHQGTSLLGQSIPAGATLEFSLRAVYAGNLTGEYLRVQCVESAF